MAEQKTTPISLDTGTVTAIVGTTGLTVQLGDRQVAAVVPSSLVGAAMAGSRVLLAVDGNVHTLTDVITGAWIGTVRLFWGTSAQVPAGELIMDGSSFSGDAYPFLQAHLGGTTLPDMRDRFPVGASGTKAAKSTGGSTTIAEANLPSHTHTVSNIGIGTVQNGDGVSANVYYPSGATSATSATGSGTAYWPPYLALHYLIKAA